eukprot:89486_1
MTSFSNKTDLEKKNVKTLRAYSRYFNIKQPYKIIVGPYFCQTIAEKRISLQDGITSVFLQRECELYTTRCCINDLQKLIHKKQTKFIRGAHILRTLKLLPCLHKDKKNNKQNTKGQSWKCIDAIRCIQLYLNKGHYCFALQPRSFLGRVRSKAGVPSIWLYQSSIVMDKLSKASQTIIQQHKNLNPQQIQEKLEINRFVEDEEIDLNYDVTKELQLDDEQNTDDDYDLDRHQKQIKPKPKTNHKKYVKRSNKPRNEKRQETRFYGRKSQNRIRYGPDGGFDTMGMNIPSRKKRRTKRGDRNKRGNDKESVRENLNDNSFETTKDSNEQMTISNSQKAMSSWWKK